MFCSVEEHDILSELCSSGLECLVAHALSVHSVDECILQWGFWDLKQLI